MSSQQTILGSVSEFCGLLSAAADEDSLDEEEEVAVVAEAVVEVVLACQDLVVCKVGDDDMLMIMRVSQGRLAI